MTTKNFKLGQVVSYTNGSPAIYTGKIVGFNGGNILVINTNDKAGFILHNAGYRVAAEITTNQVK